MTDALDLARAALAAAELRTGVQTVAPPVEVDDTPRPLSALLDTGRLPAGAASVVTGSTSLLVALLAQSQRSHDWVAVVGMPDLGILAAHQAGLDLERVALVPDTQRNQVEVIGALLDGFTYVVAGPRLALTASDRRRLLARSRERGTGLVTAGSWEQAAVRLDVTAHRWSGVTEGGGYLRHCELDVQRQAHGTTTRWTVTLPMPASPLHDPVPGHARPDVAATRSRLRLVG